MVDDDVSQENESTIKEESIQDDGKKKQFYSINLTAERVFLIFVILVAIIAVVVVAVVFSTSSKPVTKNKDVASEEVISEIVSNDDFAFFDEENGMELLEGETAPAAQDGETTQTEEVSPVTADASVSSSDTSESSNADAKNETAAVKPEVKINDKVSYSSNYNNAEETASQQTIKKNTIETQAPVEKKTVEKTSVVQQKKWVIQIGSFTSKKSADDVAAFYTKDGYPAYIKEFVKDGKTYYRLRIGPFDSDVKAEDALGKIKTSKYGKDSFVSVGYF